MTLKYMDPEAATRFIELLQNPYRPKELADLQKQIDGEIRAAELVASISGTIDMERIHKITEMRHRLDALCFDWAEGKIS